MTFERFPGPADANTPENPPEKEIAEVLEGLRAQEAARNVGSEFRISQEGIRDILKRLKSPESDQETLH